MLKKLPNVIYVHSHDTGRWIEPYGFPVSTPRLLKFASESTLFLDAHCAAPTCSPSRAALLTGQSPHACGMLGLAHRGFFLTDPSHHLCHTLKSAGYETVLAGFQHLATPRFSDPAKLGYNQILQKNESGAAELNAAKFLSEWDGSPFFMDVGFGETHRHAPPNGRFTEQDVSQLVPYKGKLPAPLPEGGAVREDFADFQAAAAIWDRKVGVVLDAIDAAGIADNTIVICTTDHGPPFPDMKCSVTEYGTGVMLIVRGPGVPAGMSVPAMVSHMDLFPTICEAAGIAPPAWLEGRSLFPLLRGEVNHLHDHLFAEVTFHAAYEPKRSARNDRFTYVRRYFDRTGPTLTNLDDSLTKSQMSGTSWRTAPQPREELFDRWRSPQDQVNCIDDPAHAAVVASLRAAMDRWMKQTNDPLLNGDITPPEWAKVTDPKFYSPTGKPEFGPHDLSRFRTGVV